MKILHISTNYTINKLYKQLIKDFNKKKLKQYVYIPIKKEYFKNKNKLNEKNIKFYYSHILNRSHRFFYKQKIKKQTKDLIKYNDFELNNLNLIHAHTWYSDGGTAYLLHKKYGIKYIVSIRNTDVNLFFKYYIHHRKFAIEILQNASKIIFISNSYKEKVKTMLENKYDINNKSVVIPNGIHEDWFKNEPKRKRVYNKEKDKLNILFMGKLNKSKNLENVIKACSKLTFDYQLNVIGDGQLYNHLNRLSKKMNVNVRFYGYIDSNTSIKEIMSENDLFILASHYETFGISYIEALSQGLPVIYTKNQGIDYMFKESSFIGEKVDSNSVNDIVNKMMKIRDNYIIYYNKGLNEINRFSWDEITNDYLDIYSGIKNEIY